MNSRKPTLYEWLGGMPVLERLTRHFYQRVGEDSVLATVFNHMPASHPHHVAVFLAEVLGGPASYSAGHGGHHHMVMQHLGRHLSEKQRQRWLALLLESADEIGMPDDPEFRSALVAYLEWGSRLAVINSQASVAGSEGTPMPRWGWGEVGGPYIAPAPAEEAPK